MVIPIYIGTEANQPHWLPSELLRFSIERRTKVKIRFEELKNMPKKGDHPLFQGFSFYRFFIPEAEGYNGKAIFLDYNTLVLTDILELFNLPMQNKGVLARLIDDPPGAHGYYTNVMLLDCEKLTHWNPEVMIVKCLIDKNCFNETMWGLPNGLATEDMGPLPPEFNSREKADSTAKIIQFADNRIQPWKITGHPETPLFLKELRDAIQEQAIPRGLIEKEIKLGHVYPQLLSDIDNPKMAVDNDKLT